MISVHVFFLILRGSNARGTMQTALASRGAAAVINSLCGGQKKHTLPGKAFQIEIPAATDCFLKKILTSASTPISCNPS